MHIELFKKIINRILVIILNLLPNTKKTYHSLKIESKYIIFYETPFGPFKKKFSIRLNGIYKIKLNMNINFTH